MYVIIYKKKKKTLQTKGTRAILGVGRFGREAFKIHKQLFLIQPFNSTLMRGTKTLESDGETELKGFFVCVLGSVFLKAERRLYHWARRNIMGSPRRVTVEISSSAGQFPIVFVTHSRGLREGTEKWETWWTPFRIPRDIEAPGMLPWRQPNPKTFSPQPGGQGPFVVHYITSW